MTPRELLERELINRYNISQFDQLVRHSLKIKLEEITLAANLSLIITEFMNHLLTRDDRLKLFLNYISERAQDIQLRGAIDDFYLAHLGIVRPSLNPYDQLVVGGEPFVDRKEFRMKLEQFFSSPHYRVLATQGPRESGRTYKAMFVQSVARANNITPVYVDLGTSRIDDMILQLRFEMHLPENELRDIMAQDSTKIKGFTWILRGVSQSFVQQGQKYCLIFDHHDRPEIAPEVKELTELLLIDAREQRLQNVYMIILGHSNWQHINVSVAGSFMSLPTTPLIEDDYAHYISELAQRYGEQITPDEIEARKAKVLQNAAMPYSIATLQAINNRVKEYIR